MARAQQSDLKREVDKAVRKAGPYIEKLARFGIASRGITYLILGELTILVAIGVRHRTASMGGMLQLLLHRPLGKVTFVILMLGFLSFGIWQWLRALRDPENEGGDWAGIRKRFGFFWTGLVNFVMAGLAIEMLVLGASHDVTGDRNAQAWAQRAMSYPLGRWALAAVGVGMVIFGIKETWRAWHLDPHEAIFDRELSRGARVVTCWIGRIGITARGVVFALIGVFLVLAGWHNRPGEVRGQGGALSVLEHEHYGSILLSIVAVGLIAYGMYALVLAWYRRIRTR